MSNRKECLIIKILAVAFMVLMLVGCGQVAYNDKADMQAKADAEVTEEAGVTREETAAANENEEATEMIRGNGGHFVKYNGKVWFQSPSEDSMRMAALWGHYDYLIEGKGCRIAAYDPEASDTEYLFEGAYFGRIVISGNRFVLGGVDGDGKPFVYSVNADGSDAKELPGTTIYGTEPSGERFVTGGYEESDHRLHFYLCSSNGSWKDVESADGFYDYVGISGEYAFFITGGYEDSGYLAGYHLGTGELTVYGELPNFAAWTEVFYPGTSEQLYTEDGQVYLHLAGYQGTGHFYMGSSFVCAKVDEADSLEETFPESDLRTVEHIDVAPAVAMIGGKLTYVDGIPGTAAINQDGDVGIYDEHGIFVSVAAGYGDVVHECDETGMHTEICEVLDGSVYLVRNSEERAPENDIGWRMAYRRLQTYIYRIDGKNGTAEIIDYIER